MTIRNGIVVVVSMWITTTFYAQNLPSREQRVYDLSHIWKDMTYNFVFTETMQKTNIDSLYFAYLSKIENVKNNYEYFRLLSAFMSHFNDGHTRIITDKRPDEPPPLELINFEEKIIVSNISKSKVNNVPVGSELIMVNDMPVLEYLKDSVYPYISASNKHWKFDKSVNEMLYGVPQSIVKLTVKTPQGNKTEVEMIRGAEEEMAISLPFSPITIKILDRNIGYVKLSSCLMQYVEEIDSIFLSWVSRLKDCDGLIIDIRGNRGGVERAWMMVAACLMPSINLQGTWLSRKHIPVYYMTGRTEQESEYNDYFIGNVMEKIEIYPIKTNLPENLQLYQKKMVVLSNSFVGSATEGFLSLIKETGRATIIGSPSAGCNSTPYIFPLSSDFQVMIAIGKYLSPDGDMFDTTGILPDIEIKIDYNAWLEGGDNVLEKAIEKLLNK